MTKRELLDLIEEMPDEAEIYLDDGSGIIRSSVYVYIDDETDIVFALSEETADAE